MQKKQVIFIVMILLLLLGCTKKLENYEMILSTVQQTTDDTQHIKSNSSKPSDSVKKDNSYHSIDNKDKNNIHSKILSKVLYTNLNNWKDNKDYYEIVFNDEMLSSINNKNVKKYILIKPDIEGKFVVKNNKTICFYPVKRFKGNTTYNVNINQEKLFQETLPKIKLKFQTIKPNVSLNKVLLVKDNDKYRVKILINEHTGHLTLKQYNELLDINIFYPRDKLKISQIKNQGSNVVTLITNSFKDKRNGYLRINTNNKNSILKNNDSFNYSNGLDNLKMLSVKNVKSITDELGNAHFEIEFSQNISQKHDLNNLIHIFDTNDRKKALDNIKIIKFDKKIIITGNFKLNHDYKISVDKDIESNLNLKLEKKYETLVTTSNIKKTIEFTDKGIFASSLENNSLNTKIVNYPKIKYMIYSINVNSLPEMMHNYQMEYLASTDLFYSYSATRNIDFYGDKIYEKTIETGVELDKAAYIKLDFNKVVKKYKKSHDKVFLVLVKGINDKKLIDSYNPNEYWNASNMFARKLIIFSDYAVETKILNNNKNHKAIINVSDITDASPIKYAKVNLYSWNNKLLAEGKTNYKGTAELDFKTIKPDNSNFKFFVFVEKKNSFGFLNSANMKIDDTPFSINRNYNENLQKYKLSAFTDRETYRPNEKIHLTMITRDNNNEIIKEKIPVIIDLYNNSRKKIFTQKITDFKDGMALLDYQLDANAHSGSWRFIIKFIGDEKVLNFNVESFVPDKIKVSLKSDKNIYLYQDSLVNIDIHSAFLYGEPNSNQECTFVTKYQANNNFGGKLFKDYSFMDDTRFINYDLYKETTTDITDENGTVYKQITIPNKEKLYQPFYINISSEVNEEGGRSVTSNKNVSVSPYNYYLALQSKREITKDGDNYSVKVALANSKGDKKIKNKKVNFKVYGRQEYWWWDYSNNNRATFKEAESTSLISQGSINLSKTNTISFKSQDEYINSFMIEVSLDDNEYIFNNRQYNKYYWNDNKDITQDNSISIKLSKTSYSANDIIKAAIPSKKDGILRVRAIYKHDIIDEKIVNLNKKSQTITKQNEFDISEEENSRYYIYELKTKRNMIPNIYLEAKIIVPQKDIEKNNSLRYFGITPVTISNPDSKLNIKLTHPEIVQSNTPFTLKIDTGKKQKAQYVVSIIDEGILAKSKIKIPNIWNYFYSTDSYRGYDYDNMNYFINSSPLEIFKTILVGGGFAKMSANNDELSVRGMMIESMLQESEVSRFKPVSIFKGIIETDDKGKSEIAINVPDYNGALKINVACASKNSFGNATSSVIVKDDVIIQPTLPRILSPNDRLTIPVHIVLDEKINSSTTVKLNVDENVIKIVGNKEITIPAYTNSAYVNFEVVVQEYIGETTFSFDVSSGSYHKTKDMNIKVRMPSTYQTDVSSLTWKDGKIMFDVQQKGYQSTNNFFLKFNTDFDFNAEALLKRTFYHNYDNACYMTINTLSQLLLRDRIKDLNDKNTIDTNINSYFRQIVYYNKNGLSKWRTGKSEKSILLNSYALHLFVLAEEKGYVTNKIVKKDIIKYLKKHEHINKSKSIDFTEAYRLYVLALADQKPISRLNYLNEQNNLTVNDNAISLLQMAFHESGFSMEDINNSIGSKITIQTQTIYKYLEPDDNLIETLNIYKTFKYNMSSHQEFYSDAKGIANSLNDINYWNYYSKLWYLLAIDAYTNKLDKKSMNKPFSVDIICDSKTKKVTIDKDNNLISLNNYLGKNITLKSLVKKPDVFVSIINMYVPKIDDSKTYRKNIDLQVNYFNESNEPINERDLKQGTNFIANIKLRFMYPNQETVTVYALPSGWEFVTDENTLQDQSLNIKDDRLIITHTPKRNNEKYDVKIKIKAITQGTFDLPATTCNNLTVPENYASLKGYRVKVSK